MTKKLMVDPPSGWRYGFPKEMPEGIPNGKELQWFVDNGYPKVMVDDGMLKYCRYWYIEDEK